MPKKLLIDGDLICHRITAKLETPCDWGNDVWTIHTDVAEAMMVFNNYIEKTLEICKGTEVIITFSDSENFRKKIDPLYKANRKGRKPVGFAALRNKIEAEYKCVTMHTLEADDVMGILQTKDSIIVSDDKDMATIPGTVYAKGNLKTYSQIAADRNWMKQSLTGDITDGYKGCPKIGPKTAEKLLEGLSEVDEMWEVVKAAYQKQGLSEEDALRNTRLARILRATDYDNKGEVILWTPNKQ